MSELRIDAFTIAPRHTLAKSVNGMSTYQTHPGEAGPFGGGRKSPDRMPRNVPHLKADVIHGRSFQSVAALRQQLRCYVHYYNYRRLHSSLGYQSPVDYERRAA
jgi:transposase InsO family protein